MPQCNKFHVVVPKSIDLEKEISSASASTTEPENPGGNAVACYIPEGSSPDATTEGVSVSRAEHQFVELSKQMSNFSQNHQRLSQTTTRESKAGQTGDVEKNGSSANKEANFNLEEVLRGNRALEEETGIKTKQVGVIWDGLTVSGIGGVKNIVRTFPSAFVSFFNVPGMVMRWMGMGKKEHQLDILKDFKGVAKPGEMILVLGRPSSGCTTFLKVISNQRFGYSKVDGEVNYGPFDADTFSTRFRGESVYNQEDDEHHAALTVGQTLGFALDLKTPGKRPAGMSKVAFKNSVINLLLAMFNISHTINTKVGGAFIRGISGGERKRVSIAEMMISSSSICAWDNSTRGLDASTASDYAKSLRIMTNIYSVTTFVSLYQASETIYRQFDKVLVIDDGREVFFGPAKEARSYFERLGFKKKPRQTTPDYLTGCTDAYEREYEDGYSAANAPHDAASLAAAFVRSKHHVRLEKEMSEYRQRLETDAETYREFELAHREAKSRHARKSSVYTAPLYMQICGLAKRQLLSKWQDKFSLVVSWITSIVVALMVGTVWYKQPETSAGAFTRGGLMFISLLFNAFQAFGELAGTLLGRTIMNKHRAFTFHRPGALFVAQIFVDGIFAAPKILIYGIIVYFLSGLALDAGAFFIFVLVIWTAYLSMALFFRTVGVLSPDFDVALRVAVLVITFFVTTSGYLIQYSTEQGWLRWMFYGNGIGLGFGALMVNEFSRLNLTCAGKSLIPNGPSYTDIKHQVCSLAGGDSGSANIEGSAYVSATFDYYHGDLWRNLGIIIALIVFFLFLNVTLGEVVNWGAGGRTVTFFSKENAEIRKLNQELMTRKENRLQRVVNQGSKLNIESRAVLTWEDLCYDVPVPGGELRLLDHVFGYVRPGSLTALMGASGAGKTTLLDVLAARKNAGVISGDILVDGIRPGTSFQRGTAYAEQLDVHESTQTVREALRFSAVLRQPFETPVEDKYSYVEEVISLLEMEDIADAIIGNTSSGLAVEQRKRVTIGIELAAKPSLLLFLDEPTSGLDSQSAFNIIRFLKKLAAAGQSILCTIHQPNATVFENFDRLLLLQKGGQCIYFGDIGKDACILLDYFHRHDAKCPADINPAEFMLDAIGAGTKPRIGKQDWAVTWLESPEFARTKAEVAAIRTERVKLVGKMVRNTEREKEYATPLWHQIKVVNARTHLAFWRSPNYGFTRLFNHAVLALTSGFVYFQLDDSRSSLQYRVFIIFQVTVLPAIIIAQVEPKYDLSRLIYYRENAAKAYSQLPFTLSMVLAEMPYSVLCAVVFYLPLYYLPGLNPSPSRASYQFLLILIVEVFSVTLGQMISALTPSTFIAMLMNPFVVVTFALFCGVTIPKTQIPKFWRSWLYELDPFTRLISGMVVTELQGKKVTCKETEYNRFSAPPGQTCGMYMDEFFADGGPGYIKSNATSLCEYCAYKVGDQFYEPLGFEFDNRWRDLGIMAAFIGSNLIFLFLGSRYLNFNKR